jgi:hypothetical protein
MNVKSTGGDRRVFDKDTPQLLRLPDAQSKKLGLLMAAKNVSFALDFKQVPTTSGALFSVYAGEYSAFTCATRTFRRTRASAVDNIGKWTSVCHTS